MGKPKGISRQVRRRIQLAQYRGEDLASMHPVEVAERLDPMAQDQIYPIPAAQAAARANLTPATWQIGVRAGWKREVERRRLVLDLGAR